MFRFIGILVSVLSLSMSARGAEIEYGRRDGCYFQINGTIEKGDFAKLKLLVTSAIAARGSLESLDSAEKSICLNSSGGSYIEGRAMANYIHNVGLGTRVVNRAQCYSVCAFIFMAGRTKGDEDDGPSRYLSAGGALGFHAPYLDLKDTETYSAADMEYSAQLMAIIIADLLKFSNFRSDFLYKNTIDPSLLAELLNTPRKELLLIDTIEKASRWDIELFDLSDRAKRGTVNYRQACVNFEKWVDGSESAVADTFLGMKAVKLKRDGKFKNFVRVDTGGMVDRYCLIEELAADGRISICDINEFNGVNYGMCPSYGISVPFYYSLHPKTPILSLYKG